jgi:hypothetical protein
VTKAAKPEILAPRSFMLASHDAIKDGRVPDDALRGVAGQLA